MMSRNPNQLKYAKTHEWADAIEQDGQKFAVIGISDFAIRQLTDLVYMDLPGVGTKVTAGEEFGEVESVKAVSPMYSPVDGEIVEVHGDLPENLERLKDDPYDFGWIMRVKLDSDDALGRLLDHDAYEKQCREEGGG
jgi:glycine cleavage system H protein